MSVHHSQFVIQFSLSHFSIQCHTKVTTILYTIERVRAATCEVGDALGTDVNDFGIGGRHPVFDGQTVLELSEADGESLVVGETIVCIIFLHLPSYVMHELERPLVSNLCICEDNGTLEIKRVGIFSSLVLVCVTCLSITMKLNPFTDVFDKFHCLLAVGLLPDHY